MYAQIAPLKRLPKSLSICDYLVPESLETEIRIGQLVIIPFRKSKIFGLVLSLCETSLYAQKAKPLESLVSSIPFLRTSEVHFFEKLAQVYNISLGTLIESSLPPLQKRKLKKNILIPHAPISSERLPKIQFIQYLTPIEHTKILDQYEQKQTLILVSEIHRAHLLAKEMSHKNIAIWHSELSVREAFELWFKIRNGEVDIIIGTRSAVFLSFFELKTIIIDDEEEKDHKQSDGNPKFSVKDIVPLLAKIHNTQTILTSSHPSSETYYKIYNHEYHIENKFIDSHQTLGVIAPIQKSAPTFIDLKTEQQGHKDDYFLSDTIQRKILSAEQDVFLFLNRRGSATSIFCKACGYKDICKICNNMRVYHDVDKMLHCHFCKTKSPIPLLCPHCGVEFLQLRGYGTEQLQKVISSLTKNTATHTIRIDSDIEEKTIPNLLSQNGKKIIIGTEVSFQYIGWKDIELCVCINLDQMLSTPEYSAEERLWHFIQKIQYERSNTSTLYIQTYNPEHNFWKSLKNPDLFYRNDLKQRKSFHYPPYSSLVKYLCNEDTPLEAKQAAEKLKQKMSTILTKESKKVTLYDPIALHPHFYRKKYWYGIIVLIETPDWMETVRELNTFLGENEKVDPRPISLLNP